MKRTEYQALRKITGGYHGSSHEKLLAIAHIEPLEVILDDISVRWAARATRTGNRTIKALLDQQATTLRDPSLAEWYDGRGASLTRTPLHPIAEAFHKTTITPEERSCGQSNNTATTPLIDLTILEPQDEKSHTPGYWQAGLGTLLDEGWRVCYTDGTGREGETAAGVYSHDRKGNPPRSYGSFAGNISSVEDGERLAIALALEKEEAEMIAIASESQAAIQSIRNISKGVPPRSQIECRIKKALTAGTRDIGILWVRGHIGICGNEQVDKQAEFESILGTISESSKIATEEGMKAISKATRKCFRQQPGFNPRTCEWNRQALSAYTWTRTERGPQNKWLHHIKKANSPLCSTCGATETGHHMVFECLKYEGIRREFLAGKGSWEDLDKADWRKVGEGDKAWYFEAVEELFGHLSTRGHDGEIDLLVGELGMTKTDEAGR